LIFFFGVLWFIKIPLNAEFMIHYKKTFDEYEREMDPNKKYLKRKKR
jgi:hypothetical protein